MHWARSSSTRGASATASRSLSYDGYWNGAAKVGSIDFVGVPDENTLTSGLLSGDIDGSYIPAISTIDRLAVRSGCHRHGRPVVRLGGV